jgi:hypothetical protein
MLQGRIASRLESSCDMLQNILGETEYYFNVCIVTNWAHAELHQEESETSLDFITVSHFILDVLNHNICLQPVLTTILPNFSSQNTICWSEEDDKKFSLNRSNILLT